MLNSIYPGSFYLFKDILVQFNLESIVFVIIAINDHKMCRTIKIMNIYLSIFQSITNNLN